MIAAAGARASGVPPAHPRGPRPWEHTPGQPGTWCSPLAVVSLIPYFTHPAICWIVSKLSGTELRAPPAPQKQVCRWWCSEVPSAREKHHSTSRMSRFSVPRAPRTAAPHSQQLYVTSHPPGSTKRPTRAALAINPQDTRSPCCSGSPRSRGSGCCDQRSEPSQHPTPKPGAPRRPPGEGITPKTAPERAGTATPATCFVNNLPLLVNERQMTVRPGKHLLSKYFRAINLSQHSSSSAR